MVKEKNESQYTSAQQILCVGIKYSHKIKDN
jgi:hypothetical protein